MNCYRFVHLIKLLEPFWSPGLQLLTSLCFMEYHDGRGSHFYISDVPMYMKSIPSARIRWNLGSVLVFDIVE